MGAGVGAERYAGCDVAGHVEHGVPDILVVEEPDTGPDHGFRVGREGNAKARREVFVRRFQERIGIGPVAADRGGCRPVDVQTCVGVRAVPLTHEEWLGHAGRRDASEIELGNGDGEQVALGVEPGWREFVAQPERKGQL